MIANPDSEIHVTSDLTGQKIAMTLSSKASDLAKLMVIMQNLYADPITAILREYSNNGRDATIEAGLDKPIEISLPNALEKVVRIRDWGIGLSVDDIHNVYSRYGASTKEETDEQTGHLGLGSKSALAYCDQFTVTSVKDGVRVMVAVSRDDDNGGSMTVVDTATTDDPSGTEVMVPVSNFDINNFRLKADRLFRYWDEGTVLVNGEQPKRIDGLRLSDHMLLTTENDESVIVMGGVPYPVRREDLNLGMSHGSNIVVWVPIGAVDHQPDREGLRLTTRTKNALSAIRDLFDELVAQAVQDAVDDAATHIEALNVLLSWKDRVPDRLKPNEYTYKGEKVPLRMEKPSADPKEPFFVVRANSNRLKDRDRIESYGAQSWSHTYWIHGFDKDDWTPTMRKKLNYYMQSVHNISYMYSERFLFTTTKIESPYIDDSRRIEWSEIEATKLPRNVGSRAGQSGRIPGSYDIIEDGVNRYGIPGDDLDPALPLFWCNTNNLGGWEIRRYAALFEVEYPNFTIVALRSNRINKFQRLFPEAKSCYKAASEAAARFEATITDAQREAWAWQDKLNDSEFSLIDPDRVDDPDIKLACKMLKIDLSDLRNNINRFAEGQAAVGNIGGKFSQSVSDPLTKYLLLDSGSRYHSDRVPRSLEQREHFYMYVNSFYATLDKSDKTD